MLGKVSDCEWKPKPLVLLFLGLFPISPNVTVRELLNRKTHFRNSLQTRRFTKAFDSLHVLNTNICIIIILFSNALSFI